MSALLDAFRGTKRWQVGALAIALIGAFGATYGTYYLLDGSGGTGLNDDQQLIPVQYGDLVNEISVSGSLIFPNRESLIFGTGGVVAEVLVEENQSVQEGQPLARLNEETIATLEQAVAQARINLRNAEDALEEAKSPYTSLEVAKAEAEVSDARLAFKKAQEDLESLMEPTALDVAKAEAAVSSARLSVITVEEALEALTQGASDDDLSSANSKVRSARTTLANADRDLILARSDWEDKLQIAQDALDAALEEQQAVFEKWLGVEPTEEEIRLGPDALLESWGTDLDSLFDPNQRYPDIRQPLQAQGLNGDDPATPWSEITLYTWLHLYPGDVIVNCDSTTSSEALCVQQEFDDAWQAYSEQRDNLDSMKTQAEKAISNAEEAVSSAKESLASAEEALADLQAVPDPLDVESKEKDLALALAALDQAQDDLANLAGDPDPLELDSRQKQVALAQMALEEAEKELTSMSEGADPLDVALREADVVAAQTALDDAIQRLENATLKAPWDGIVTAINVEASQEVNPNSSVMEIVDPTVIEMSGIVDEIDVLFIQKGAAARVTMDALPGQVLPGTVSTVASEPQTQQGVVSFPLRIQVEPPAGVQLPEGLSAVASVVIREDTDVLLVPLQSLYGTFEQPAVRVMMSNGSIEERPVILGNSDDFWAVVEGGLSEGDMVVIESQQANTDQFGPGGGFRRFGGTGGLTGGFPGGALQRVPNRN